MGQQRSSDERARENILRSAAKGYVRHRAAGINCLDSADPKERAVGQSARVNILLAATADCRIVRNVIIELKAATQHDRAECYIVVVLCTACTENRAVRFPAIE